INAIMLAGLDVHAAKPATKLFAPHLVALSHRCSGISSNECLGLCNITHEHPSEPSCRAKLFDRRSIGTDDRVAAVLAIVAILQDFSAEIHKIQSWFRSAAYSRRGDGK